MQKQSVNHNETMSPINCLMNKKKETDTTPRGYLSPVTPISPLHDSINKITKRIVSDRCIELAANFWHKYIACLSVEDRLVEFLMSVSYCISEETFSCTLWHFGCC